jgi:nitrite reductase/ring-hydroxylating ferredoxin subunit
MGERHGAPDWQQANPTAINRALQHALAKPSGGWMVLDATRNITSRATKSNPKNSNKGTLQTAVQSAVQTGVQTALHLTRRNSHATPRRYLVDGHEVIATKHPTTGAVVVAPARCPHMGAHLGDGHLRNDGCVVCPWHGLALPLAQDERVAGQGRWSPIRTFDDGVLTWIQPDPTASDATDAPILTKRPDRFVDAVIRREGICEPRDIIANRLDPWHGVHFHPYAFAHLDVIDHTDDYLDLRVGYRVTPKHVMTVEARFDCPDPRTIVMTITGGEGTGSVVETHATPVVPASPGVSPRTAVIEATLATSDRPGFVNALKGVAIARPAIGFLANRLWRDDMQYAQRLWHVRNMQ